jgi:putative ABC transport system substrate-binding protein
VIDRRQALGLIAGAVLAPGALAQEGKVWRIGILFGTRRPASTATHPFAAGLRDLGYVEGKNVTLEWRFAEERLDRLPALAVELVKLNPDVIVAANTAASRAAQKATATIPIVMLSVGDPVGAGLVDSLARPGRNITGLSMVSSDLGLKWFEIARSLVPNLERVGVLLNSGNPAYRATLEGVWTAARPAKMLVFPVEANSAAEFERAFEQLKRAGVGALVVQPDELFTNRRVAELAMKMRLPSVSGRPDRADSGVLISYGVNVKQLQRRGAIYVDKILKGAKAGDLPVEQPRDYELIVNLKTAKAIGITIPKELLLRASEVIE